MGSRGGSAAILYSSRCRFLPQPHGTPSSSKKVTFGLSRNTTAGESASALRGGEGLGPLLGQRAAPSWAAHGAAGGPWLPGLPALIQKPCQPAVWRSVLPPRRSAGCLPRGERGRGARLSYRFQ